MKCTVEFGVYIKKTQYQNLLIVCLYVDNLIITKDMLSEINNSRLE